MNRELKWLNVKEMELIGEVTFITEYNSDNRHFIFRVEGASSDCICFLEDDSNWDSVYDCMCEPRVKIVVKEIAISVEDNKVFANVIRIGE